MINYFYLCTLNTLQKFRIFIFLDFLFLGKKIRKIGIEKEK